MRVRLGGLDLDAPRVEPVNDAQIGEVRLDTVRGDAVLIAGLNGGRGEVRAETLVDPFRLVLTFSRAKDRLAPDGPLRHIVLDAGHGGHD